MNGHSRCNSPSKDGVRLRHEVLVVPEKMSRGRVADDRIGVPAQLLIVGQTAVSDVPDAKGRTVVARQTDRVDVEDLQGHRRSMVSLPHRFLSLATSRTNSSFW
jgi:hypothetical protein